MRNRVHGLPLAVLGGIFLLLQALAVGLGPGMLVCLDSACPVLVATVVDGCCGGNCDGEMPHEPAEQNCGCPWLPISSGDTTQLAVFTPTPVLVTTLPPILLPLPATLVRLVVWPPIPRSSPHLFSLRSIVLTC